MQHQQHNPAMMQQHQAVFLLPPLQQHNPPVLQQHQAVFLLPPPQQHNPPVLQQHQAVFLLPPPQQHNKFGVLLNFHNLQKEELLQQCQTLSTTLTHDSQPDINGTELAMEMQNFPPLPSKNMTNMELLTFLHEKKLAEIYPNMWVALRIFATLPVTVAAAERSFSKLKLIKTYLRSTMMQERLSGLSIISINHVVSNQLSYDDVVDDFAARKTRRVRL
ncbi:uncharacterized protein LOC112844606 [Oreochromis niloticus]|uniref:uncharacterized protein LOC112843556 n=1 Tax=Oreochromis niloticus TaxID=8128 RepID=UPI000DF29A0D|nr:uncharacterized protein LOC112843556 [Oreochromis niloticus]XP_025760022.1 uncharacterized protein LOC112844606 [Oreochromis niloticus]